MLTIQDLRFFSTIAAADSLAAAARAMNVTSSAVTQRLRQLEERLGVQLVDRSTRHFALTPEGELLATQGEEIMAETDSLVDALTGGRMTVAGRLRITAPFGFGRRFVAPAASEFRVQFPQASVFLELLENPISPKAGVWDVIIHIGELNDSSTQMRRLARNDRILCASTDYLAQHAPIAKPSDLLDQDCAALRENDEDTTLWRFTNAAGETETVRIRPEMATNDGEVLHKWALSGVAVVVRSEWDVADDIKAGRLVRLLPEFTLGSADVVALLGPRSTRMARTTHFLDILQRQLTPLPWRT